MHQNTVSKLMETSNHLEVKGYKYSGETITSIAIIGCGASGVAAIASLVEQIKKSNHRKYKINIFEKSPNFGPGLAYQFDSDDLLMNMISSTTSIFENRETDFWDWVISKGYEFGFDEIMSGSGVSPDGYISRQFFGLYLKDRLNDAIIEAKKLDISVTLDNYEVIDIERKDKYLEVTDCAKRISQFEYVILCLGNVNPQDVYRLKGNSQYINNPYPIKRYAMGIGKNDCVGIIGGQLTAADIAVVLARQGHTGAVHFFTRGANYPLVRCRSEKFELRHFNLQNLETIKSSQFGEISLRQALRFARKDFIRAGIKWNKFFNPVKLSYQEWIEYLFSNGHMYAEWQHFAVASDAVIGSYWHALDVASKKIFMGRYHRLWMCKRVPLPIHSYLKIYSLFKSGILQSHSQLLDIKVNSTNKFIASIAGPVHSGDQIQIECDWVINATGPARLVDEDSESPLISNLIKSGLIIANSFGGIHIDYETSMVKSKGETVENFYAIGHLTAGTYYFVSSLDMVSLGAKRVAHDLVNSSKRSMMSRKPIEEKLLGVENAI